MQKQYLFRCFLIGIAISGCKSAFAQNLVPNPSFEDTVQCPFGISNGAYDFLSYSTGWYRPTVGTPDYFNSCNNSPVGVPANLRGWENAKTGVAYAGICTGGRNGGLNYREYIQTQLSDTLINGYKYTVSFYVSPADSFGYRCNNIGAFLSQTAISSSTSSALPVTPQVENTSINPLINNNGWIQVVDTFTAIGGELYITIGNFRNGTNSDTVFVGGSQSAIDYAFYYIDDASVKITQPDGLNNPEHNMLFEIYPNPATNKTTLWYPLLPDRKGEFEIYDVLGNLCLTETIRSGINESEINISTLKNGIYYCRFKSGIKTSAMKKLAISR